MPVPARITAVTTLTPQEKLFTIELPHELSLGHEPGQFVRSVCPGRGRSAHQHHLLAQPQQWQL
jgi:NAD(P)H-flavin reductase